MNENGYVYTLEHPDTGEIRYVGATKDPDARLLAHQVNPHGDELSEWVEMLQENGKQPKMDIVHTVPLEELEKYEQQEIDRLKDTHNLLNAHYSSGYSPHQGARKPYDTDTLRVPDPVYEQLMADADEWNMTAGEVVVQWMKSAGVEIDEEWFHEM